MSTGIISEKRDLQSATDVTPPATAATDYSDCVLLTIHGVTSDNKGLANLRAYCEEQLPGIICDSYYYGSVVPFSDLSKDVAHMIFQAVTQKIEQVYAENPERRLYVVAHSFGTLAVVEALRDGVDATIEALILLGSIVPRGKRWDGHVKNNLLRNAPFAVVRPLDPIVPLADLVGGEDSGASGFIASGRVLVRETFKNGGHTSYDPDDGPDIVAIVRSGKLVSSTSYAEWLKSCGKLQRLEVKLFRLFRLFGMFGLFRLFRLFKL